MFCMKPTLPTVSPTVNVDANHVTLTAYWIGELMVVLEELMSTSYQDMSMVPLSQLKDLDDT